MIDDIDVVAFDSTLSAIFMIAEILVYAVWPFEEIWDIKQRVGSLLVNSETCFIENALFKHG